MLLLIGLGIYVVFGTIAICMFFNWISTGDPYRFPGDDAR